MFEHKVTGPNASKGKNVAPQKEGAADKMNPSNDGGGESTPARVMYGETPAPTRGR